MDRFFNGKDRDAERERLERDREADRKFKETMSEAATAIPKALADLGDAIRQGSDQNGRNSKRHGGE
ncbi:hypothetical protein W97_05365 [Coniosporium apollinis CBS 100218]|uniref:Uncharacterized protein n=1 Tax=Coniosporium apollinis (strain CBS 100218) TaxID=1168221 RepID=R7YW62_CONA1|nr:uncharacterized protein W97_05365 [Coniosporium apollinis CBS 100218]EON66122.1 hypothetical protein W97_05365 [Coniosporium apollinis CBS 100218]